MKNNLIPFPGTEPGASQNEDDFCGAGGFMFESGPSDRMAKVYELEARALSHIALMLRDCESAGIEYHGPEASTQEFKHLLLEVLHRRQRENVRDGKVLTVSHPLMSPEEQVPFLKERSEVPAITVRHATGEDLAMMDSLRFIFPVLVDVRNAIRSAHRKLNGFPGFFV